MSSFRPTAHCRAHRWNAATTSLGLAIAAARIIEIASSSSVSLDWRKPSFLYHFRHDVHSHRFPRHCRERRGPAPCVDVLRMRCLKRTDQVRECGGADVHLNRIKLKGGYRLFRARDRRHSRECSRLRQVGRRATPRRNVQPASGLWSQAARSLLEPRCNVRAILRSTGPESQSISRVSVMCSQSSGKTWGSRPGSRIWPVTRRWSAVLP